MRLIVFDCDGTLVDSQQTIITATQTALAAHDFAAPSRRDILYAVGLPIDVALRGHVPQASDDQIVNMLDLYRETYQDLVQQDDRGQVMFNGMYDQIAELGGLDDTLLGIITMKSRRGLNRVVDAYDIRKFFQVLKSADDGPGKPAPDLMLDAMRETGTAPEQSLMIGDTSFDIMMAKAAGAQAIGVGWGYQTVDELEQSGADDIAKTPEDLRRLLAQFQPA
jgi:phosphoglycolate phosphatase